MFKPAGYVRWMLARSIFPYFWVRLDGSVVPRAGEPDKRNWALQIADAMNASWPDPDPWWPIDRAAADAEVEQDEGV